MKASELISILKNMHPESGVYMDNDCEQGCCPNFKAIKDVYKIRSDLFNDKGEVVIIQLTERR